MATRSDFNKKLQSVEPYYVGKRLIRKEVELPYASGSAKYSIDADLPGMLYAKVLRSPYAHAKILSIDTSKAEKLAGVIAVATGKHGIEYTKNGDLNGVYGVPHLPDKNILAVDKVRFFGEEVAAVVALTPTIASEALDLINVEYKELPAVVDVEYAVRPESSLIHEELQGQVNLGYKIKGNVIHELILNYGDINRSMKESDIIVKGRTKTSQQQMCPLELENCTAYYDEGAELLTVIAPKQSVHTNRESISLLFGIPQNRIHYISPRVGGAFGHRCDTHGTDVIAILLTLMTRKPVKIVLSREEEFLATRSRPIILYELELGVKRDGLIMGMRGKALLAMGAYANSGLSIMSYSLNLLCGTYKIPSAYVIGYPVYTTTAPNGPARGFGSPDGCFARETLFDKTARELEMDPYDFRMKNLIQEKDIPGEFNNKIYFPSLKIESCLKRAHELVDYKKIKEENKSHVGIGISNQMHFGGGDRWVAVVDSDPYGAVVRIEPDTSVILAIDIQDLGQGHKHSMAQICADELGLNINNIRVIQGDSDIIPHGVGSFGSRSVHGGGWAVTLACKDVMRKIYKIAGHLLNVNPTILKAKGGKIFNGEQPQKTIDYAEVVQIAYNEKNKLPEGMETGHLIGVGQYDSPTKWWPLDNHCGNTSTSYGTGTTIAVVEVDASTGKVKILDYVITEDCGRPINPQICMGQLEGAAVQGIGYALCEGMIYNSEGKLLNSTFSEYRILGIGDVPPMKVELIDSYDPMAPQGQKGIGEMGMNNAAATISNAIYDAIGIQFTELPITPEKVLRALDEKKDK